MSSGTVMSIFVMAFFVLLACGMVAILVFGVLTIVRSGERKDAAIAHAHAAGRLDATPGHEQGTWYVRFTPDLGALGALVPFSGTRRLGLLRLAGGHLEFWPKDARTPAWVVPVGDLRVRTVDFAFGRLAEYPLRLDSPQSGALLGEVSLEPLNTFGELQLKDQRNHEYTRHFVELLVAAGAQRKT